MLMLSAPYCIHILKVPFTKDCEKIVRGFVIIRFLLSLFDVAQSNQEATTIQNNLQFVF